MSKECVTHHHACDCREEKFKQLEQENAELRKDGDRLEYLFWPSGSTKARYWVRKLMASRDYDDPSPILKIWRDAIDAARKETRT